MYMQARKTNQSWIKVKPLSKAFILLFVTLAYAQEGPSLTGKWSIHQSIVGKDSDLQCDFAEKGDALTGTCSSPDDKGLAVSGSVEGHKVKWKYNSDYNGTTMTLTYSATVDTPDKIAGTVDVQPFGVTGEFTATPSKK